MKKGKIKAKVAGLEFEFSLKDLKAALKKALKEDSKHAKTSFLIRGQQTSR